MLDKCSESTEDKNLGGASHDTSPAPPICDAAKSNNTFDILRVVEYNYTQKNQLH
jgi:hypothetical protein